MYITIDRNQMHNLDPRVRLKDATRLSKANKSSLSARDRTPSDDGIVTLEMTNLERGLYYVKLKVREMVRRAGPDSSSRPPSDSISPQIDSDKKTDQCGVVVFGTPGTACPSGFLA